MRKFDGFKIEHIWDVLQLYLKLSRSLEMRDAIVSNLSETFKLDKVDGKTATSKQVSNSHPTNLMQQNLDFALYHRKHIE